MHGANASGRPFTGDYAGHPAVRDAARVRLRDAAGRRRRATTACALIDCRITNAVKCLPPGNKPTPAEVRDVQRLPRGRPARRCPTAARSWRSAASRTTRRCARSGCARPRFPFAHGAAHRAATAARLLVDSYHCSRYNTNTRRLTPAMFRRGVRPRSPRISPAAAVRDGHAALEGHDAVDRPTPQPAPPFDARELLASLPHRPGVYRMFDAAGETLYVGKARDLKKRVSSYFQKTGARDAHRARWSRRSRASRRRSRARRARRCCSRTTSSRRTSRATTSCSATTRATRTSASPATRSRSCASIAARSTAATATSGRFPSAGAVREGIALLQKVFQLRTCENTVFANRSRPCMLHQIQRCTAPCVGLIGEAEYREDVEGADAVPAGQGGRSADAAAGADGGGGGGARVRARGAPPRQDRAPAAAAVAAVRRERDRRRHRRRRGGGRAAAWSRSTS